MSGLGHLGIGLAAKRATPKTPLVVLLLSPMLLDIIWGLFLFLGIEPITWSHSFLMAVTWSFIAAILTGVITKKSHTSMIIGVLVFSHWVVDFITHPMGFIFPNDTGIPIFFKGSSLVGLGMYNTLAGVILGEIIFIVPGIIVYAIAKKELRNEKLRQSIRTL